MKISRKLHLQDSRATPVAMYRNVVETIERILGNQGNPNAELFGDSDAFAEKYLAYNLRRKSVHLSDDPKTAQEKQQVALAGFLLRETVNKKVNANYTFGYDPLLDDYSSDEIGLQILYRARAIIKDCLGSCNPSTYALLGDFGSGASATLKRATATPGHKYLLGSTVTPLLHDFSKLFIESCPHWSHALSHKDVMYVNSEGLHSLPPGSLKRFSGAIADYVAKDAKTDRMIFKEPELNGYFQKGMGNLIRSRLARYKRFTPDGMNISTSGDLNAELAKQGSKHGHISTIDAERASDSLSIVLYEFLFPEDWVVEFKKLRSPYTLINGKWHRNELMSGMGNGFTFEAESLIFYAIGCAASERSKLHNASIYVSVHGDDLTVPSDVFSDTCAAYAACAIVVNEGKSFSKGPFRESCGGHYFGGHSVKPFYLKKQRGDNRGDWFWLYNSLLLWCGERSETWHSSNKARDLYQVLAFIAGRATDGKTDQWSIPRHFGRRSGLYRPPYVATGVSWKNRLVKSKPILAAKAADDGNYLDMLRNPITRATVLDLCLHKSEILRVESDYFTTNVVEYDGQSRIWDWPSFPEGLAVSLCHSQGGQS